MLAGRDTTELRILICAEKGPTKWAREKRCAREREREGESSRGRALRDLGRFGIRFVAEKVRGWRADDKQTCSSGIGGKRDRSDGAGTQRFDGELVSREPLRAEIET